MTITLALLTACADRNGVPVIGMDGSRQAIFSDVPGRDAAAGSWAGRTAGEVWRQGALSDSSFIVGLKRPGYPRGVWRYRVLVSPAERSEGTRALSHMEGVQVLGESEVLPMLLIRIADATVLGRVRSMPWIDYVEPNFTGPADLVAAYDLQRSGPRLNSDLDSSLGCSSPSEYNNFGGVVPEGDPYSWSQSAGYNDVVGAWRRSQGDDIRVALLDTGVDAWQSQLTTRFNANAAASRAAWYLYTDASGRFPPSTDDCGHGTRMAGIISAPRDGQNVVGIAWKADLISIRVNDDVHVGETWKAVNAIELAMDPQRPAHIIVMAFMATGSETDALRDIIRYYYERRDADGRRNGPLFIAAAGTSNAPDPLYNGNVIFPAEMEEVIAVSAVDQNRNLWPTSHYGPEVELAGFVPQATVGIPGVYPGSPGVTRLVGSSAATASVAGIAALVWSRYSWMNNIQVRHRLRNAASQHPYHTPESGFGTIHAYKAVGGFVGAGISGPTSAAPSSTATFTATTVGDGPFSYRWSNGATSRTASYNVGQYGFWLTVEVTDLYENVTREAIHRVEVGGDGGSDPVCDPNLDPRCPA